MNKVIILSEDNAYQMLVKPISGSYSVAVYYMEFNTLEFNDTIDFVSLEMVCEEYGFDFSKLVKELDKIEQDTLNPSGSVFVDYNPEARVRKKYVDNITTLDKTMGRSPDETIIVYRGCPKAQKEIRAGDYITTNKQLAQDYAGTGHIISKRVKLSDILDDKNEPLGEEYIYFPKKEIK